jgi:transcription initiation factor TFIID subunit 2
MTLRVYDDEGIPYEQTIDIRETVHRTEIHYNNTRRAKRKRKDSTALTNGDIPAATEDIVFSLGDVLSSPDEVRDWRLVESTSDDEDRIAQEAFEWIRIDADLEWICDISLGMPEWMYAAQLRQDRDVVAQYEASSFLSCSNNRLSNSLRRLKNLLRSQPQ